MKEFRQAFEKAKADLYLSHDSYPKRPVFEMLIDADEDFDRGLLKSRFEKFDFYNMKDTYTVIPKNGHKGIDSKEIRVVECMPIEAHILSAMWLNEIGWRFEEKLPKCVYGNRMERIHSRKDGNACSAALGAHQVARGKWASDALKVIDGFNTVLISDFTNFFGLINPLFMIDDEYLKSIDVEIPIDNLDLHSRFIYMLNAWSNQNGEGSPSLGLPTGLAASCLIANVALLEFDKSMIEHKKVQHYGRYIDDIVVVLDGIKEGDDLVDWVGNSSLCINSVGVSLNSGLFTFNNLKKVVMKGLFKADSDLSEKIRKALHVGSVAYDGCVDNDPSEEDKGINSLFESISGIFDKLPKTDEVVIEKLGIRGCMYALDVINGNKTNTSLFYIWKQAQFVIDNCVAYNQFDIVLDYINTVRDKCNLFSLSLSENFEQVALDLLEEGLRGLRHQNAYQEELSKALASCRPLERMELLEDAGKASKGNREAKLDAYRENHPDASDKMLIANAIKACGEYK